MFEQAAAQARAARDEISQIIYGQQDVIDQALITLLAGGHGMIVGVPGLAKTLLVETIGTVMGLDVKRIQFTPDLMPADITGAEVMEEGATGKRSFRFIPGPVFCQLLMADEINRASPRTQAALLQSMQERQVTVSGVNHPLPTPFHVLATRNPLEQEGTYPLPEAQLDRFMLEIPIQYPDSTAEREMLVRTTGAQAAHAKTVLDAPALLGIQALVREMPVGEVVVNGILDVVRAARPESSPLDAVKKYVGWGPGPRAGQALMLAARARALLDGRLSPSLDDVAALLPAVLRHRMALNFTARAEGVTLETVIGALAERVLLG